MTKGSKVVKIAVYADEGLLQAFNMWRTVHMPLKPLTQAIQRVMIDRIRQDGIPVPSTLTSSTVTTMETIVPIATEATPATKRSYVKLDEKQTREFYKDLANKVPLQEIAAKFGLRVARVKEMAKKQVEPPADDQNTEE